jgi:hypothetical protein
MKVNGAFMRDFKQETGENVERIDPYRSYQ